MTADAFYKVESFIPMTGSHVTVHLSLWDAAPTISEAMQNPDVERMSLYERVDGKWSLLHENDRSGR